MLKTLRRKRTYSGSLPKLHLASAPQAVASRIRNAQWPLMRNWPYAPGEEVSEPEYGGLG
jgi:hypothetical protein